MQPEIHIMKIRHFLPLLAAFAVSCTGRQTAPTPLKEAFADRFLVGTALNEAQITGADARGAALVAREFNSVVAENCMKCEKIHPARDSFDFVLPDRFVEFGERHGMFVVGHTLVWHSQCAPWFFVDDRGRDVSRDELIARMREHITTVVSRYRGRVKGWDVVNEAILDDGSLRPSKFLEIIGEEYLALAFRFAHEADPDAELYYNDFAMASPGKRGRTVQLVRDLRAAGLRIDGVGMQGHMGMDYPDAAEFERSIRAFADAGVKVMITEWDVTVLPTVTQGAEVSDSFAYRQEMNPYPDGLPTGVEEAWNERIRTFFDIFVRNSDVISRVTAWGVTDGDTWRNDWPMPGRRDYPLLFDREYRMKPVVAEIIEKNKR